MAISPSISIPSASSFPATLAKPSPYPLFATRRFLSGENKPRFLVLFSGDRKLLSPARARLKEVVLGSPSVTVEKGKYSYEVETLINKLSSLPPRGSIARCLDMCKNKLSLNDFALVFKEFAQRGDWQRSLRLFKYMQRQIWCKPNEHIYTIMISLLGREGLLEKAAEVFDEMPAQSVARSVFSYTALINAYGRNGKYQEALELLERMKRDRVPPSILTYNTVINACSRGGLDWEGLLGLFAEMRHEGVQPDLATYNTLLGACAARKLGDEAEMVFRTMNGGGTVVPDRTTYRCLVETFGKLGSLEKVSALLREMEIGGNSPDITSYNVLLEAYAECGSTVEAVGVFRQMQEAGCPPNAHTYSTLLNLYGRNGRYDDVRELFLDMKVSNTEPDAATYNILIGVFGEGGYFKEVVTLFHDMVDENVEPNMETYEGLLTACGKGGLYEDAKAILIYASSRGVVPSSRAYTGVVEAYGQAALYEEAIVMFNTMSEVGSAPGLETFESLIGAFSRGGLYLEAEALLAKMGAIGAPRTVRSFNGLVEAFRQGGRFEDAVRAYGEMGKAKCSPDERTFEALLSVYCFAGLVEESEEHFEVIKASGINPSVMCYCMMLAVYARCDRWDDAFKLLDEMLNNKASNIHQVVGQMIKGDFDDGSNWQMVEYVFDKLNSEGCGFGIRFYNTLLEALWWMGQKERAARVLNEATKRGLFPELFRRNKLVWSIDVHRMWEGGACTALSIWLNDMLEMFLCGEDLPHLATVVVVRGKLERSPDGQETPIAKAAHSFLQENMFSSFDFPAWNKGRLVCQRAQLKQILMGLETSSDGSVKTDKIISLRNSFAVPGTRLSNTTGVNIGQPSNSRTELVTSSV